MGRAECGTSLVGRAECGERLVGTVLILIKCMQIK